MVSTARLLAACAFLLVLASAPAAPASEPEPAEQAEAPQPQELPPEAQALYDKAWRAMHAGNAEDALKHLDEAFARHPLPVLLYNRGRVLEEMGRTEAAYDAYLAVQATPGVSPVLAELAELRAQAVEPLALPEPPVVAGAGEENDATRVAVSARPLDLGPWPWVLLGTGAAAAGAGGWLLAAAAERRDTVRGMRIDPEAQRVVTLTQADAYRLRDEANELSAAGVATLVAGGTLVTSGLVLWWVSDGDTPEEATWICGPSSLGLRLRL